MPVPASIMISLSMPSNRNSRQSVFPPYFMVWGPGEGMEPLTPQNLIIIKLPFKRDLTQVVQKSRQKILFVFCPKYTLNGGQILHSLPYANEARAAAMTERCTKYIGTQQMISFEKISALQMQSTV
jgi:hypothetical protein